jgi:lysophospholipase L1-like esterase
MRSQFRSVLAACSLMAGVAVSCFGQTAVTDFKFSFGGPATDGFVRVMPDQSYTKDRGYGFEPVPAIAEGFGYITTNRLFQFSVAVPEGNYHVTVTLGDSRGESTTTVKAETRRLMLDRVHTKSGETVKREFTVNVRRPEISTSETVTLDTRENGSKTWDEKLTLQFSDDRPCVDAIEIHKIDDAVTVFLCGDSTVTDQASEPYGTWGQMLPRWFGPGVAIADHAESGETLKAFVFEHRWDKVMSQVKPADYVFMQFGHNDLNKTGHNAMWPGPEGEWSHTYSEANTDYKRLLEDYAGQVKARGAIPVIVSPMTKINIRDGKLNTAGLGDYPSAAVAAAKEAGVACIDLNAMSVRIVNALGEVQDKRAYVDGLHTNSYGGYLLSRCIVEGIRENKLDLAKYIVDDAGTFDPDHPLPLVDDFKLPLEPGGGGGFRFGAGTRRSTTAPITNPSR